MFMNRTRMILQLNELADMGFELGRHLQRRALTAETPREKAKLSAAFLAIAYEVRRTVDLEIRLIREAGRVGRRRGPNPAPHLDAAVPADAVKH